MSDTLTDAHLKWARGFTGVDIGTASEPEEADDDHDEAPSGTAETGQPTQPNGPSDGEAEADDTDVAKAKQVTEASDKLTKTSEDDIRKLSSADKVKLLKELQANGTPTGDARAAQLKLLRNTELDPDFKKKETERGDAIAKELKGDKDLKNARDNWSKLSDDDKIKALKKIVAAQSKQYGIDPPEIEKEDKEPYTAANGHKRIESGHYSPKDGKLHLNVNKKSKMADFSKAIDLVLHENAHKYQAKLIKDLKDGKLKPGDPEYNEARIFAQNDGGGYIQPKEDPKTYEKQPKENHSRVMAAETMPKIVNGL